MNIDRKLATQNNRHFSNFYYYTGKYHVETKIRLTRYSNKVLEHIDVSPGEESFRRLISPECINWFMVEGLMDAFNISRLLNEFGMHSLDAREILTPGHVVKIDVNTNYIIIVLNSCSIDSNNQTHSEHVCLLVAEKVVISFNESHNHLFSNVDEGLKDNTMNIRGEKSGMLFAFLLNSIMADLMETAGKVEKMLEKIENRLLSRNYNQNNIGHKIQNCRHASLILRKNSTPLVEDFNQLLIPKQNIIDPVLFPVFKDLSDQLLYIVETTKNNANILISLVELYVSNNDLRTNAIMKRLTIVSTIFSPITFLVGVWGMNFKYMPELEWKYGYLFAWIILLGMAIWIWFYMKRKKWF